MEKRAAYRKTGIVAAVATVLLGSLLLFPLQPLHSPNPLVRWSYDSLQLFLPEFNHSAPVIIYMDEQAMQDYQQKPGYWDRGIHAGLLDRLSRDRPKVVVFDVMPTQAGDPGVDDKFARAIRKNGRVIVGGDRVPITGFKGNTIVEPLEQIATNAAAWGIPFVATDPDRVARRYDTGGEQTIDLPWAAAMVAEAPVAREPQRRRAEVRWLNYYGSARPFEQFSMTYRTAENAEPGFFTDKAVFIGGKPQTLDRGDVTDLFGTPFTKWNSTFTPGVDITAIAYTNLIHEEWLRRTGLLAEFGIVLLVGAGVGLGLRRVRLQTALWISSATAIVVIAGAIAGVLLIRTWFPWMVVAFVQLPCAFLVRLYRHRTDIQPEAVEIETGHTSPVPTGAPASQGQLEIPDHTLIRCIGEGAYGQVWIARNAVGLYHAVKVVYRSRFGVEEPFERALRGIQKFMPISRSHDGFVHILHVGKNDAAGFFFYIMEAGDDQRSGQQINPDTYAPKTLASELKERQMIPPRECLEFMLAVTEAVERLHQHKLIHRDIKPANLIFVNGRPKLADIDLVTDLSPHGEASHIGTEGYMAPEGPGAAAADVFSLGRILYVALTGKPPDQSPELPTRIASHPDSALLMELNDIVCKACEFDLERRYSSAAMMRQDLLNVSHRVPR